MEASSMQPAAVPAGFTLIRHNEWGGLIRQTRQLPRDWICSRSHPGSCRASVCPSWANQVECGHVQVGKDICGNVFFGSLSAAGLNLESFRREDDGAGSCCSIGLRALTAFAKGDLLSEITGVVTDCELLASPQRAFILDDGLVLDCSARGSLGSLVPHSCMPSACLQTWYVPVDQTQYETRLGLFALDAISAGEMITADLRSMLFDFHDSDASCAASHPGVGCKRAARTQRVRMREGRPLSQRSSKRRAIPSRELSAAVKEACEHNTALNISDAMQRSQLDQHCHRFSKMSCPANEADSALDWTTIVSNIMQGKKFDVSIQKDMSVAMDLSRATKICSLSLWGVPFRGEGPSGATAKRAACHQAFKVFRAYYENSAQPGPTVPADVSKRDRDEWLPPLRASSADALATGADRLTTTLHDCLAVVWIAMREYQLAKQNPALHSVDSASGRLRESPLASLQRSVQALFPSVGHVLRMCGHSTLFCHGCRDPGAKLLHDRAKKIEIGTYRRLALSTSEDKPGSNHGVGNLFHINNGCWGNFVVDLGPIVVHKNLEELLAYGGWTLDDIVDRHSFENPVQDDDGNAETALPLTEDTLLPVVLPANSRSTQICSAQIRGVVYPVQTYADALHLLNLLEKRYVKVSSEERLKLHKRAVLGTPLCRDPALYFGQDIEVCPEGWSSQVIARTMGMPIATYLETKAQCEHLSTVLSSCGHAWIPLEMDNILQMRRILTKWVEMVDMCAPGTQSSEQGSSFVRRIGSSVQEYMVCPGTPRSESKLRALKSFLRCLSGVSIGDPAAEQVISDLCVTADRGCSPIARCPNGECFQELELKLVLLAEIRSGNHNVTVCPYVALFADEGCTRQCEHMDTTRLESLVGSLPLWEDGTHAFDLTLVPDYALDFGTVYSDSQQGNSHYETRESVGQAYDGFISLDPFEMHNRMRPARLNACGGFLVTLGDLLHAGPGNPRPRPGGDVRPGGHDAPLRRGLAFCATGTKGNHYDGSGQVFSIDLIERRHGFLCFWSVLHVLSKALCFGVHVAQHYDTVECGGGVQSWVKAGFPGRWSKGKLYDELLRCARLLLEPSKSEELLEPLIGTPVGSAVDAGTGYHRLLFGTRAYSPKQVKVVTVALWNMLTCVSDDTVDELVHGHFAVVGFEGQPSGWHGQKFLRATRAAFTEASQRKYSLALDSQVFGLAAIRDEVHTLLSRATWEELSASVDEVDSVLGV